MVRNIFYSIALLGVLVPMRVFAAHTTDTSFPDIVGPGSEGSSWGGLDDFYAGLCGIANWFFGFVLVLAVIFILYAAFLFLSAGGNDQKVTRARSFLIYGLVGIAIAFLGRAFVFIVGNLVGAPTTFNSLGC